MGHFVLCVGDYASRMASMEDIAVQTLCAEHAMRAGRACIFSVMRGTDGDANPVHYVLNIDEPIGRVRWERRWYGFRLFVESADA